MQSIADRLMDAIDEELGIWLPEASEREWANVAVTVLVSLAASFAAAADLDRRATVALITIAAESAADDIFAGDGQ